MLEHETVRMFFSHHQATHCPVLPVLYNLYLYYVPYCYIQTHAQASSCKSAVFYNITSSLKLEKSQAAFHFLWNFLLNSLPQKFLEGLLSSWKWANCQHKNYTQDSVRQAYFAFIRDISLLSPSVYPFSGSNTLSWVCSFVHAVFVYTRMYSMILCGPHKSAVFCSITSLLKLEESLAYQKIELFTYLFLPVFSWRGLQWERRSVMEFTLRKTQE